MNVLLWPQAAMSNTSQVAEGVICARRVVSLDVCTHLNSHPQAQTGICEEVVLFAQKPKVIQHNSLF